MKRISAIAISLLLIIGLTAEAQAVTSGVYKCYVAQGPTSDPSTFLVPDITHYNPNATGVQNITRIRIFDSIGVLIFDQAFSPGTFTVNGRGSDHAAVAATGFAEGLQILVNWRQAADALAPIPKIVLLLFDDTSGIFTSVSQSNCG
jgi:hypothetical protein